LKHALSNNRKTKRIYEEQLYKVGTTGPFPALSERVGMAKKMETARRKGACLSGCEVTAPFLSRTFFRSAFEGTRHPK